MSTLWQDVRYGFRMLRKAPGFTAIALVTLALGIGANTIMFSVTDMLLFRSVQVEKPEEVVCCKVRNPKFGLGTMPYGGYRTLNQDNPVFSDMMAQDEGLGFVTLAYETTARQVCGMFVSTNYFAFLGTPPVLGRGFRPDEEGRDAAPVTVLSYRTWKRIGGDPEMVGRTVRVNGVPCEVVGVAAKGFTGATHLGPDLWLPLGNHHRVVEMPRGIAGPGRAADEWWGYPGVIPVGRLKPGLDMATAHAQLRTFAPRFKERYPRLWKANSAFYLHRLPKFAILNDQNEHRALTGVSGILMGVSAAVLLIACLNLATMMIAHGARRHREIAVRLALGGSRLRIIRQLLIESGLLAFLGGTLGFVLAFWGTAVLNGWLVVSNMPLDLVSGLSVGLSGRAMVVTIGFCLLATLLAGLRPALGLSRRDVITDLKESSGAVLRPMRRHGRLSMLGQTALAVVLLMGATLFTRGAIKALHPSDEFDFDGKLLVEADTLAAGYDLVHTQEVYETLAEKLRGLPGVETVGVSASFPFSGADGYGGTVREYKPEIESERNDETQERRRFVRGAPGVFHVGADYFDAMGMPFLQGRPFRRIDSTANAEKVVIVDERVARRLRPDGMVLGCVITYGEETSPYRIVGIVPSLKIATDEDVPSPQIYVPMGTDHRPAFLHLRLNETTRRRGAILEQQIRQAIREVDPHLPIVTAASLAEYYHENPTVWLAIIGARLAAGSGAMALFLASLGIYAVKGYMVASRTPEIGIRKALGATHMDIMGMVFREGTALTLAGLVVGLLLGLGTARLIASLLYGVGPVDIISIAAAIALLGTASLLASYIPARRAAKIDPIDALRYE